jgi:hypothetical protein
MLSDANAKIVADVNRMRRELEQVAESDKDASRRRQAARWLATLQRFTDLVAECAKERGCR